MQLGLFAPLLSLPKPSCPQSLGPNMKTRPVSGLYKRRKERNFYKIKKKKKILYNKYVKNKKTTYFSLDEKNNQ